MVNGVTTSVYGTPLSGLWQVTIDIGLTLITVSAVSPDGTIETRWQGARATYAPNNIWIFNSDTNGLTGRYLTALGSVTPRSTITPRTGYEGLGRTISAETVAGANLKLELPLNYDPRVPSPLIIQFHGNGSNEHIFSDNTAQKATLPALTNAGFMVLSVGLISNTTSWGAQVSLDAYTAAYQWVRDRFNIGPIGLFANSMGGIESELVLAEGRIPNIAAWVGHSPTANLAEAFANAALFTAPIKGSYGIASDGSDYAAKTAGHDPLLLPGYAFRGVPMLFLAATDDTTVPKATNTDALAALVAPYSPEVVVQSGITGGHSFIITSGYAAQIVNFFKKYLGDPA
jgi:pimeloyl-ACP methyl ester carboxylesterase